MPLFDRDYEVILADTEASRAIHRKIRYHVYCLEHRFENPGAFPRGEEHDAWDNHSALFIVRNRRSGTWVAAVRLVLPHGASFPLEKLNCLTSDIDRPSRNAFAEASRICIIRSSSPWQINPHMDWDYGHVGRTGESEILLGMLRTLFVYCAKHSLEYVYLLITDALARLLRRWGLVLHSIGTRIDHRGLRAPYLVKRLESIKSMGEKSVLVRDLLARQTLAYRPFSAFSATEEISVPMLPAASFPPPTADLSWRMDGASRSRPGPGAWRGAA
ncbi:MAG: PEP-CTERM/exosortase system-associated acyltransferase [Gammaproteobacteria bacterium]|nr:PEP-CTERM/exosortase system-associated acyltransferase [Gammaproteobacteria bacterium]MCP5196436.1 PEP-CTERM/exosortase system-associated acyltransferase [Gammaproteobacteria bacterium]